MRALVFIAIIACLLLVGCLPNPVSVSRDGTIALTLSEEGKYELIQGEGRQVYLTNATADFLTKIEGMEECRFPAISPSGKFIAACSDDRLVLYDRETKKRRIIDRSRMEDGTLDFPTWSPDERKIAFFRGNYDSPYILKVYDLKRRQLEVLDRHALPQATWLPDGKRLLYISAPPAAWEDGAAPFGDLRMINTKTGRQKTIAPGQLLGLSDIAAFPDSKSVLFPFLNWEDADLTPEGLTFPILLKREPLPLAQKVDGQAVGDKPQEKRGREGESTRDEAGPEENRAGEDPDEQPQQAFTLHEGQPFYPMSCAVSPDGKRIAYVRYLWDLSSAGAGGVGGDEAMGEKPEGAQEELDEPEGVDEIDNELQGVEFCVANADGTGGLVIARGERDENAQVLWLGNTRLLCVNDDTIVAVDADGKNPFDLTEAIRTKFADQFSPPQDEVERGGGST